MAEKRCRVSHEELLELSLNNRYEYMRSGVRSPEGKHYRGPDMEWVYTAFGNIILFHIQLEEERDRVQRKIEQLLASHGHLPAVVCLLDPATKPQGLGKQLKEQGFVHASDLYGMVLDLSTLPLFPEQKGPEDYAVQEVRDAQDLGVWSRLVGETFGVGGEAFDRMILHSAQTPSSYYYLGMLGGKPAATAAVLVADGVAGIYWVSTVEKARRKGLSTVLMQKVLRQAADLGCSHAVLQSTDMGRGLYRKLGFEDLYVEHSYEWYRDRANEAEKEMREMNNVEISYRPVQNTSETDVQFLWEMLYQCIYVPEGKEWPSREILSEPEIAKYLENWGKPGDMGILAVDGSGAPVGAVWARLFDEAHQGYGFVNEQTPEISMAVVDDYRGRGIGAALLARMKEVAAAQGYPSLSLSVDPANFAMKLYEKHGFRVVGQSGTSLTMMADL